MSWHQDWLNLAWFKAWPLVAWLVVVVLNLTSSFICPQQPSKVIGLLLHLCYENWLDWYSVWALFFSHLPFSLWHSLRSDSNSYIRLQPIELDDKYELICWSSDQKWSRTGKSGWQQCLIKQQWRQEVGRGIIWGPKVVTWERERERETDDDIK